MNTLRNSAEEIPPFFIALPFLTLKETECIVRPTGPIGHPVYTFLKASTSFPPSATTSSDWELRALPGCISTPNTIRPSSRGEGRSQWELPLELLCPDSCCAPTQIFSMSALWTGEEEGMCPHPPFSSLPQSWPLLLMATATIIPIVHGQLPRGTAEASWQGPRLFPFLAVVFVVKGEWPSTKWDDIAGQLEDLW